MALIGFARVSTKGQDISDQIAQLKKAGCIKIFTGKNSGRRESNKARLAELLDYVREDDTIIATHIDRLGRSSRQIIELLYYLEDHNIYLKTLDGWIDTQKRNDIMTKSILHLLSAFAELDRKMIISRTKEGKRAKIEAGDLSAIGGRPRKVTDEIKKSIFKDFEKGLSLNKTAEKYGLSRSTIATVKKEYKAKIVKG